MGSSPHRRFSLESLGEFAMSLLLPMHPSAVEDGPPRQTAADAAGIRAVIEKYRTSWLAGDAEGALSTFTEDAVLLPAQGGAPVVGLAAIRRYWWPPDAPKTRVTKLTITCEQVGGDSIIGFVRGRDEVEWTVGGEGTTHSRANAGTYLNVMRKLPDGSWRISHHMWDDDPARRR